MLKSNIGFYSNSVLDISTFKTRKKSFLVTIVGREHYYESYRDIPIGKQDEIIAAAKHMDDLAPFSGVSSFFIENISQDKSRVYFFTIKEDVYHSISIHSLLIIPETLLLLSWFKRNNTNELFEYKSESRKIKASYQKHLFISFLGDVTGKNSIITPQLGIEEVNEGAVVNVSEYEYFKLLTAQLFILPRYVYMQLFNGKLIKNGIDKLPIKRMAITSCSVFLAYMLMISTWLFYKSEKIENELLMQQESLEQVFSLQAQLVQQSEIQENLINNNKLMDITSQVWSNLLSLVSSGAELLSVNYLDNEYIIRVKSNKSTDVIEFLSKQSGISQPKLVSPAIKSRGKEIITLKLTLSGVAN